MPMLNNADAKHGNAKQCWCKAMLMLSNANAKQC